MERTDIRFREYFAPPFPIYRENYSWLAGQFVNGSSALEKELKDEEGNVAVKLQRGRAIAEGIPEEVVAMYRLDHGKTTEFYCLDSFGLRDFAYPQQPGDESSPKVVYHFHLGKYPPGTTFEEAESLRYRMSQRAFGLAASYSRLPDNQATEDISHSS